MSTTWINTKKYYRKKEKYNNTKKRDKKIKDEAFYDL